MIECHKCSKILAGGKGPLVSNMKWHWLEASEFRMRVPFCEDCEPDDQVINKFSFKKFKLKDYTNTHWGQSINLVEYAALVGGNKCPECLNEISDNEKMLVGWKLYHKKCRGVYPSRYKENHVF